MLYHPSVPSSPSLNDQTYEYKNTGAGGEREKGLVLFQSTWIFETLPVIQRFRLVSDCATIQMQKEKND